MIEDINMYEKIFGSDIYTLNGNTVCNKPKAMVNSYFNIPQELKNALQNIEICADIMFIQRKMFLVSISNTIKFIMIQKITERKIPILNKVFDNTFVVYNHAVF